VFLVFGTDAVVRLAASRLVVIVEKFVRGPVTDRQNPPIGFFEQTGIAFSAEEAAEKFRKTHKLCLTRKFYQKESRTLGCTDDHNFCRSSPTSPVVAKWANRAVRLLLTQQR